MEELSGPFRGILLTDKSVVTVGKFDALHVGHMRLIDATVALARETGASPVLLTFGGMAGDRQSRLLTRGETAERIEAAGVGIYIIMDFDNELREMAAERFVEDILLERLNCISVVAGEGFRFGHDRLGDVALLEKMGAEHGFAARAVPDVAGPDGARISSARIRELVFSCDFGAAAELLGYNYYISGEVGHGKKLGRKLGFPTINVVPAPEKLLPPDGVYATKTVISGDESVYPGVTNVGVNPTVWGGPAAGRRVESYLFGFEGDAYGRGIKTEFIGRIRGEVKFGSVGELREQIARDVESAKKYFYE